MKDGNTGVRIAENLRTALAKALSSMTGKEFRISLDEESGIGEIREPLISEQYLSFGDEACLWVCAGRDLWTAAGQLTLAAVGVDSVTDEDCRSTWQEIVAQTIGAFCGSLSADLKTEITAGKSDEIDREPPHVRWAAFTTTSGENGTWRVKIGWSKALTDLYDRSEPPKNIQPLKNSTSSKTFDLLLDVALPVSVSFGRTSLAIREVLKLNTGSIVELNRFVAEPVEVIVNDCVIARGEVVVVDGNYGIRITQLASREDRLKFGTAETPSRFGVPLR
jgi:flagellar motor switch protein FliN/FliY